MSIVHIILIGFKPETASEKVIEIIDAFFALKDKCVRDGKTYIKSVKAGQCNLAQQFVPMAGGHTHGLVVEFDNEEDRDYYFTEDAAHADILKLSGPFVAKMIVFDFAEGVYGGSSNDEQNVKAKV